MFQPQSQGSDCRSVCSCDADVFIIADMCCLTFIHVFAYSCLRARFVRDARRPCVSSPARTKCIENAVAEPALVAGPGDVYGVEARRDTNGMLEALNNSAVRAVLWIPVADLP